MPSRAKSAAAPLPDGPFSPELCVPKLSPPLGDQWLHEIKFDGYRLLATIVGGRVRLWSRNGNEWTSRVPAIAEAVATLGLGSAQLDGELIAVVDGRDSFNALHTGLASGRVRLVYELFDAPYLEHDLRKSPLIERKEALHAMLERRPHPLLTYSQHIVGHGAEALAHAIEHHREGIVCKRVDSPYTGRRSGHWLKVKARPTGEFTVIGFTERAGVKGSIGALLLAERGEHGLQYVGRVGTGFSERLLRELRAVLEQEVIAAPAADVARTKPADRQGAKWVRPKLVADVLYNGRAASGLLRQTAFKSIRAA